MVGQLLNGEPKLPGANDSTPATNHWGLVEVHDESDALVEVHCLPFGRNPTTGDSVLLWWHTTSSLCGCNPRMDVRPDRVKVYAHHEREDDGEDHDS